ncbi:MAG: hypothetical protein Q4P18_07895 [Methanobrevibacter sp.]|uniref:5-methylcytosine restriction system specificity protein McrC n=1 Tax=Methanobrevibacter sp. TaxID=66852 RepID=UPI0026E01EED|nr:hypothetical protein [Methanobrevibacter sp.]MDO5849442.1 hypothetical protein [Methanobrevibacter sp.]
MIESEIPIQNIYYMLSYAYKRLKINETIFKESVDFNNIYDLLSRILINIVNTLIKRGFYKDYIQVNDDIKGVKGKINLSDSIKRQTLLNHSLNCEFDEFAEDVPFNQIIKATIDSLLRIRDLNKKYKKQLKKFRPFFINVSNIELNKQIFKSLNWNRNNKYYNVAITICELIFLYKLPNDNIDGKIAFKDFIQSFEKELANLFEEFVYNFYKRELNDIRVHKPHIKWNIDDEFNNVGLEYLPNMRTDIVLETNDSQLIIDTKFYKSIFSNFHEIEKINSSNLYQITNYISNSDFEGEIQGMLLYASLGKDIDYQYRINNHNIYIKTLDLNQNWEEIEKRLKEIAGLLNQ